MDDTQDTRSTLPISVNSSTDPNSLETLQIPSLTSNLEFARQSRCSKELEGYTIRAGREFTATGVQQQHEVSERTAQRDALLYEHNTRNHDLQRIMQERTLQSESLATVIRTLEQTRSEQYELQELVEARESELTELRAFYRDFGGANQQ
eukprot:6473964-Amphidinium_carterae.1